VDKTKPEVSEQQSETVGEIKTETLANFLELLTLRYIRAEREELEKNASQ
jgi:hypothetical protein